MSSLKLLFHDGRLPDSYEADQDAGKPGQSTPPRWILEKDTPLSRSVLWQMQKGFYEHEGVKAWSEGSTPFYITSNPFIARSYARVVLGYLRDWAGSQSGIKNGERSKQLDPTQPIYIIELGAGSGRLGYLFLRQLLEMKRTLAVDTVPICYVMTDFTESNLAFWNTHPALQPYIQSGVLDFALFDASQQKELTLTRSGTVLSPGTVSNPVVVLSNYVFDSLTQDAFRVQGGKLHETLLTISSDRQAPDLGDPELLDHISLGTTNSPVSTQYYPDPQWNRILEEYEQRLDNTSVLFPTGSLTCIRNLTELAGGRMLMLTADKGLREEGDLKAQDTYYIVVHGGFSLRVNYDAIARYFHNTGGAAFDSTAWDTTFLVSGFIAGGTQDDFPETALAFRESIDGFGPYYFYSLLTCTQKDCASVSLEHVLALWRLSAWDPAMLRAFGRVLLGRAEFVSPALQREIRLAIDSSWENFFSIGERTDLPFDMARILHEMKHREAAVRYYQYSLDFCGEQYATLYNMGMCLYELGRMSEALECFDKLLKDDPEDSMILACRDRVHEGRKMKEEG